MLILSNYSRIVLGMKGGKKKDSSSISKVITREYTIDIYKCTHGVGFMMHASWALKKKFENLP